MEWSELSAESRPQPVVDVQSLHALELSNVVGNENRANCEGVGSDQQVIGPDRCAESSEGIPNPTTFPSTGIVKRKTEKLRWISRNTSR